MKLIRKLFLNESLSAREIVFNVVLIVGLLLSLIGFFLWMPTEHIRAAASLAFGFVVFVICNILSFRFGRYELSKHIIYWSITIIILPVLFWSFGGANGLVPNFWMIMTILYMFAIFERKVLAVYLTITIIVDGILFYSSYLHPEYVGMEMSRGVRVLLFFVTIMAISLFTGGILWIQASLFDKERARFEEQARNLEESRDLKSELYAGLSHQIRTPINTIVGANELLLREELTTEERECAEKVAEAAKTLNSMVSDVLDISRLENERFELETEDYEVRDFLKEILDMASAPCEEKGLHLYLNANFEMPAVLHGDRKRVRQIITNLANNAIEFTEQGSVSIDVQGIPISDREMEMKIVVADTGIGIRKEEIDTVFESFRKSRDVIGGSQSGAGLGLSIARQLARLMGGDIIIDSIYKRGTIFTVTLKQEIVDFTPMGDMNLAEEYRPKERYQTSFISPRGRVLIVDDNEINGIITKSLLAPTMLQIDVVKSGAECLLLTREKYYDVILMDFLMPRMNGIETFRALRKQENGLCRDSAVLILTANTQESAKTVCRENGFDGYLEKPLYGATLEREIVKYLPKEIVEYTKLDYDSGGSIVDSVGKKRKKIYITTDCVCDLPSELVERYGIKMIYLPIETPRGTFIDGKEIDSSSLEQYLAEEEENPVRPKAPSVREYEEFFGEALGQAEDVIHISMAAFAGESYKNACEAAKGFGHVHVVDSGQVSGGEGILVQRAARMSIEGFSSERIIARLEEDKKKVVCYVFTPSVYGFYKRGYVGKIFGMFLLLLKICPSIQLRNSRPAIGEITFGKPEAALKKFLRKHMRNRRVSEDILLITYVNRSAKERDMIEREVKKYRKFKRMFMVKAGFSTGCSAGNGAVCLAYYEK